MHIKSLHLKQFRNYDDASFEFSRGLNILIGENAQGKTNALEAIYLCAVGKSHRTSKDADLIRWQCQESTIMANVVMHDRDWILKMMLRPVGKQALVNGVSLSKMTEFIGHLQVVLFSPEDLQLVKAGPSVRRRFIDMELGQTFKSYLYHLSQYHRALQQRNALLKKLSYSMDWKLIEPFEEQLIEHGVQILLRRTAFTSRMEDLSNRIYQGISNGRDEMKIKYSSSILKLDAHPDISAESLTHQFETSLYAKRDNDTQVGYTTVGPHRDDLILLLDDKPVLGHASQGQQRTIALSLRLAEIDFVFEEAGEYPVLLLDDVLSELDDVRQHNLILNMSKKVQTIITTTSLYRLTDQLDSTASVFHVDSGIIRSGG